MQLARPVGREAASRKYDILSALMAHAFSHDGSTQRQVFRLLALITTRYNWQRNELGIGQTEIARLWCVDTRTVKREMARLRARNWLVQKRQGARGRVSVYALNLERMLEDTRPDWPNIGPDFVERMTQQDRGTDQTNVVPLRPIPPPLPTGTLWSEARARLHHDDPAVYAAWFEPLEEVEACNGCLTLAAPTRFHATYVEGQFKTRILAAVACVDPSVRNVRVIE